MVVDYVEFVVMCCCSNVFGFCFVVMFVEWVELFCDGFED